MTTLDAVQTTLAAEHAAVYVYAALGGQTSRTGSPVLFAAISSAYATHRARRDRLVQEVSDLGGSPVAAEPAYELPQRLGTVTGVNRAALDLERACAETYASLVANTAGSARRWAIAALTDAAVRELGFRGTPEMLPGAAEYADR
ncbi:MAG TPA: ferritin-like domain-containing protein [Nocardioides sp.]|nr:ferritin-like domain-containing protein [Nocardioides sp.]